MFTNFDIEGIRRNLTRVIIISFCVGCTVLSLAGEGISPLINRVQFTVAPGQLGLPVGPPYGLPGSAVEGERLGPWPMSPFAAPDSADDDVYEIIPALGVLYSNWKLVDDGFPTIPFHGVGIGPLPGTIPPAQATLPDDDNNMNALAIRAPEINFEEIFPPETPLEEKVLILRGWFGEEGMFLQFTVDNHAIGLPGTGVNQESILSELPGDLFEAFPPPLPPFPPAPPAPGGNVLIADEGSMGLEAALDPLDDDVDGFILNDDINTVPNRIDTTGDATPDTPEFFFSVDLPSIPVGASGITPGDILIPGTGSGGMPAVNPFVFIPHVVLGLQPDDDVDALFIDASGMYVIFSLSAGSPSLPQIIDPYGAAPGADPGDVLIVDLSSGPIAVPMVLFHAIELGIRGDDIGGASPDDDELNGLWITMMPMNTFFMGPPVISLQPLTQSACLGTSVTFSVTASPLPLYFQWRFNMVPISGATSSSYTISSVLGSDAGIYDCLVTDQFGNSVISAAAALTVLALPTITVQPTSRQACQGGSTTFTVGATKAPVLSYLWYKVGSGSLGVTTSFLTINPITTADAGSYYCAVINTCGTVNSNSASLTVSTPPNITTQPVGTSKCFGETATFTVAASASPSPSYLWYKVGSGSLGVTTPTLTITPVSSGDAGSYYCAVSNVCGTVNSTNVTLTVHAPVNITLQPVDTDKCPGDTATFTVAATGTPAPSYLWYKDGSGSLGVTTATLTITPISAGDAGNYYCAVSNTCGSANSTPATLAVLNPVTFNSHPASVQVCVGDRATFTVSASGEPTLSYSWIKDSIALGVYTTTLTVDPIAAGDAGSYWCAVTNTCGTENSNPATLTLGGTLGIGVSPTVDVVGLGSNTFEPNLICAIPDITVNWYADSIAPGNLVQTTTTPPHTFETFQTYFASTVFWVEVFDNQNRATATTNVLLLCAVDAKYFDYYLDDCNDLNDLWLLATEWRDSTSPDNDDPNGDGIVDILDFLYINLSNFCVP